MIRRLIEFIQRSALLIFGIGFVGISLIPLSIFVRAVQKNGLGIDAVIGAWMTSLFMGVGIGAVCLSRYVARTQADKDRQKTQWPGRPWMWRADWRSLEITDSLWPKTYFNAGLAGFAGYFISGFCFVFAAKGREDEGPMDLWFVWVILGTFVLIAIGLAIAAVGSVRRARAWGTSRLHLASVPTGLGEPFVARLFASKRLDVRDRIVVTISCSAPTEVRQQFVGRDVGESQTVNATKWSESRIVQSFLPARHPGEVCVPIAFAIPRNAPGTSQQNHVDWNLEVRSDRGKYRYAAEFEIPVFGLKESRDVSVASKHFEQFAKHLQAASFDEIVADRNGSIVCDLPDRLEIQFGIFDKKQAALGMIGAPAIAAVFWGFSSAFGAFATLVAVGVISEALATTTIIMDNTHLHRRRAVLGIGMTRRFALDQIDCVTSTIEAEPNGVSNCVRLTTHRGKTHTIVDRIANHNIGAAIASRMTQHLRRFEKAPNHIDHQT